jgi:hypothetical protein
MDGNHSNQLPVQHPRLWSRLAAAVSRFRPLRRNQEASFIVLSVRKVGSVTPPSSVSREPQTLSSPVPAPLLNHCTRDSYSSSIVSSPRIQFHGSIPATCSSQGALGRQSGYGLDMASPSSTMPRPPRVSTTEPPRSAMGSHMAQLQQPVSVNHSAGSNAQALRRSPATFSVIFTNLENVITPQARRWDVPVDRQPARCNEPLSTASFQGKRQTPQLKIDTAMLIDGIKTLPSQRPREVPRVIPCQIPRVIPCQITSRAPQMTSHLGPRLRRRAGSRSLRESAAAVGGTIDDAPRWHV